MDEIKDLISHYWNQFIELITSHGLISAAFAIVIGFCILYVILDGD